MYRICFVKPTFKSEERIVLNRWPLVAPTPPPHPNPLPGLKKKEEEEKYVLFVQTSVWMKYHLHLNSYYLDVGRYSGSHSSAVSVIPGVFFKLMFSNFWRIHVMRDPIFRMEVIRFSCWDIDHHKFWSCRVAVHTLHCRRSRWKVQGTFWRSLLVREWAQKLSNHHLHHQ